MFEKESIPFAPALIESMRSIGYSFESAIADLLDNSISANAKNIEIDIECDENPYLTILDDGYGMSGEKLEEAMRYGSKNPTDKRAETDLGRFGLGMKSASLSQCRRMVVISKKDNKINAFSWDLDYIINTNSWLLKGYSEEEIVKFPNVNKLLAKESGTLIYLDNFDRIKNSTNDLSRTLTSNMVRAEEHITLVFHIFIQEGLKIYINSREIVGKDPFLVTNKKTQPKREEIIEINKEIIRVKPYILPHIAHLSKKDIENVGGKEKLKRDQGFYIYRNKRLIIWGTWFRLENKQELTKLARVKVDIPNSLDYMWNIDIKKSSASLPDSIKKNLCSCVLEAIGGSEKVHNYRGRKARENENYEYIWDRVSNLERDGYEYKINRNIPQIDILKKRLGNSDFKLVEYLLKNIEENLPIAALYLDASKGDINEENNADDELLFEQLKENVEIIKSQGLDIKIVLKMLLNTEPYCNNIKLIEKAKMEWEVI